MPFRTRARQSLVFQELEYSKVASIAPSEITVSLRRSMSPERLLI
jgi:hypothetical protein